MTIAYYLIPVKEDEEAIPVEEALKKIDYDVNDRATMWNKNDIDKIVKTMTKENASTMILQFLPDPIGDKFAVLFKINL